MSVFVWVVTGPLQIERRGAIGEAEARHELGERALLRRGVAPLAQHVASNGRVGHEFRNMKCRANYRLPRRNFFPESAELTPPGREPKLNPQKTSATT